MDERMARFLEANHLGSMTVYRPDGHAHSFHVAVALVDGKIWSSAVERRMRTVYVRLNPRCQLLVFPTRPGGSTRYHHGAPGSEFLGLEATVSILDGPETADLSVRLHRALQPQAPAGTLRWGGRTLTEGEFRQAMQAEGRIVYEFDPFRVFGRY